MKIIDAHQHLYTGSDPEAEQLLHYMDINGVEKLLMIGCEDCIAGYVGNNEAVAKAVKKHPDRFTGAVWVDPRAESTAVGDIIKYHQEGFTCVKMFPVFGFYPDDPAIYPVYELIIELDMALMFHAGGGSAAIGNEINKVTGRKNVRAAFPSYKYSLPCYYDALGHGFPEMKIILAHFGGCMHIPEILFLVDNHKNMYLDTSCSSATAALKEVLRQDNQYVKPLKPNKLLWGKDSLLPEDRNAPSPRLKEQQELLAELTGNDQSLLEDIFYNNAKRLLKM